MWAEDGHDGPLPALDAASVANSVIELAHLTERMLTEGRFGGACASLQEPWDAI